VLDGGGRQSNTRSAHSAQLHVCLELPGNYKFITK
jgi:hypothetical protein